MKRAILVLFIFTLLYPYWPIDSAQAATNETKTVKLQDKTDPTKTVWTYDNAVEIPAGSTIVSVQVDSQNAQYTSSTTGDKISISVKVNGKPRTISAKDVFGFSGAETCECFISTPGNYIWRKADGVTWQINTADSQGNYTSPVYVTNNGVNPPSDVEVFTQSPLDVQARAREASWKETLTGSKVAPTNIDFKTVKLGSVKGDGLTTKVSTDGNRIVSSYKLTSLHFVKIVYDQPMGINEVNPPTPQGTLVRGILYKVKQEYKLLAKTNPGTEYTFGGTVVVTYTPPATPYVEAKCVVNPTKVTITNADVTVQVTASAKLFNFNAANAGEWTYKLITSDGRESKTSGGFDQGMLTASNKTYTFTIPASKMVGATYTETFTLTAKVGLMNNAKKSLEIQTTCQTTAYKGDIPKDDDPIIDNPGPDPEPDNNLPPVPMITAPDIVRSGETFMYSGFGSYDPEDGTNIKYRWHYWKVGGGPIGNGATTMDGELRLTEIGTYRLYLAVTDTKGKSASTTQLITVIPPTPKAQIKALGYLKEKRPIVLDGSGSNSPDAFPIIDSSRAFTITPLFDAQASDIYRIGNLTGTTKIDVMFKKAGDYRVTYTVKNTAGYTDTESKVITIKEDEKPVAEISSYSLNYRDPDNDNKAVFPLEDTSYSPDGDMIDSRSCMVTYNSHNDGNFENETAKAPLTINPATLQGVFKATYVGKYQLSCIVQETFDAGPFASYLTPDDYLKSDPALKIIEVDNISPSTGLLVGKEYKADIVLNIGHLPAGDKQYIINQLPVVKTNLKARGVDAQLMNNIWNPLVEADYFKDSNAKLLGTTWRTQTDQKYFVGLTDKLDAISGKPELNIINLPAIPVGNQSINGTIRGANVAKSGKIYVDTEVSTTNGYNFGYAVIDGDTTTQVKTSYSNIDGASTNCGRRAEVDSEGSRYYIYNCYTSSSGGQYNSNDYLFAPEIPGFGSGAIQIKGYPHASGYDHNQIHSRLSLMNAGWTLWSTSGIFYMDTWDQKSNYFRKASNGWNPATSPDYNTSTPKQSIDTLNYGASVGGIDYWTGSGGVEAAGGGTYYATMRINGGLINLTNYSIYYAFASGNSFNVMAKNNTDQKMYWLKYTNGALAATVKLLNYPSNGEKIVKPNKTNNRMYFISTVSADGISYNTLTEYDLQTDTIISKKVLPQGYLFYDIGFDSDQSVKYLYGVVGSSLIFYSKENDTRTPDPNTLVMTNTSNYSCGSYSYNLAGDRSCYKAITGTSSSYETYSKVTRIGKDGKVATKLFAGSEGYVLYGTYTYSDGDVVTFGAQNGVPFYALYSEGFVPHLLNFPLSAYWIYDSYGYVISPAEDVVRFYVRTDSNTWNIYTFNRATGTVQDSTAALAAENPYTIDQSYFVSGITYYLNASVNGTDPIFGKTSYNSDSYNLNEVSVVVGPDGYYYATAVIENRTTGAITTLLRTNKPGTNASSGNRNMSINARNGFLKVFDNTIYYYAFDGQKTTIYRVNVPEVAPLNITFVAESTIPNTMRISGFIGNTRKPYSNSYSSVPTTFSEPLPISIPESLQLSKPMIDAVGTPTFDEASGSFWAIKSVIDSAAGVYKHSMLFYDEETESHFVKTHELNSLIYFKSAFYYKGSYYMLMEDRTTNTNIKNSIYKATKTGLTLLYSVSQTVGGVTSTPYKIVLDQDGYIYVYTRDGVDYGITTNKSGTFVKKKVTFPALPNQNSMIESGGLLLFTNSNDTGLFSLPVSELVANAAPAFQNAFNFPALAGLYTYSKISNPFYENGRYYAIVQGKEKSTDSSYVPYLVTSDGKKYKQVSDYYVAGNKIYLISQRDYQIIDKSSFLLKESEQLPQNYQYYTLLSSPGKLLVYLPSTKLDSVVKIVTAIRGNPFDPDFLNTVVSNKINTVFSGTGIANKVADINAATDGFTIDYAIGVSNVLDQLVDYIADHIKGTKEGKPNYYLLGESMVYQGIYFDFEEDPLLQGLYRFTHDPSVFDNNQGIISTNGQLVTTPINPFTKVGKYDIEYLGQDDPTYGNEALAPYRKWSKMSQPFTIYVHRKPFALFEVKLKDNPSNIALVNASFVDKSYDLDHTVSDPDTKGITAWDWKWKETDGTVWNTGLPSALGRNKEYIVTLVVTDMEGAKSDPYSVVFKTDAASIIPNTPPVVNIIDPASAAAATPTMYATLTPTIKWTYFDADGDPQQKYQLFIYDSTNTLIHSSGEVISGSKSYNVPAGLLQEGKVYNVQVKASDGFDYSALAAKKYFKIVTNQPPVADFDWTPKPVWEGDLLTIVNKSTDPDGDPLTYEWTIYDPDNIKMLYSTKDVILNNVKKGTYKVTLVAKDATLSSAPVTKDIVVGELYVLGQVNHTPQWENNRQQWNTANTSNQRSYDTFWAGEEFILTSSVTDTGASSTKANKVTVTLVEKSITVDLNTTQPSKLDWSGSMWRTNFDKLKDGDYHFKFTAYWSNGVEKSTTVTIKIKGNIWDVTKTHRIH